jgi:hypothetical protein
MLMPWGKYRQMELSDIPTSYLQWVMREAASASPILIAAVRAELDQRQEGQPDRESTQLMDEDDEPGIRDILKSWYREMTLRYHPDRTLDDGSAMKAINHGYKYLLELFGVSR